MIKPTLQNVFENLNWGIYSMCDNCPYLERNAGADDEPPSSECACEEADQCNAAAVRFKDMMDDYNYEQEIA